MKKEAEFLNCIEQEINISKATKTAQNSNRRAPIATNNVTSSTSNSINSCESNDWSDSSIFSDESDNSDGSDDSNDENWQTYAEARASKLMRIPDDSYSTINRQNLSCRQAYTSSKEVVLAFKKDLSDVNLNKTTIARNRIKVMIADADKAKTDMLNYDGPLVLHWDSKLVEEQNSMSKIDRLAVIVTGAKMEQLLGIPIVKGKAESQSQNIVQLLDDWQITRKIAALCFDTTSTNSGRLTGVCVRLNRILDKDLLLLACRHHVHEIILESIFAECFGKSDGPEILLFKRFRSFWNQVDVRKRRTYRQLAKLKKVLPKSSVDILLSFLKSYEKKCTLPRGDYKEHCSTAILP